MNYRVVYTARAKRDLDEAANWIAQYDPAVGERWFNGFVHALETLRRDPAAYSMAPESDRCSVDIRQLIYRTRSRRSNRALFMIEGSTVYILAIRRPGQDLLSEEELRTAITDLR